MKAINTIKTDLIDKILTSEKQVRLNDAQKTILTMSEEDIKCGRLIPQCRMDEEDMAWLSEQ